MPTLSAGTQVQAFSAHVSSYYRLAMSRMRPSLALLPFGTGSARRAVRQTNSLLRFTIAAGLARAHCPAESAAGGTRPATFTGTRLVVLYLLVANPNTAASAMARSITFSPLVTDVTSARSETTFKLQRSRIIAKQ